MPNPERVKKIKKVAVQRQQGVVILEDITDPHNAAAVLRSCEAFGIQRVCFVFDREKRFNPRKIGKAVSASANKWLDFEIYASAEECFKKLKRQGYEIFATVLDEQARSIFESRLTWPKTALVFGNEHRGLSPEAVGLADFRVYVPMQGFVQSLNLSVTAAVCLYEMRRQRQAAKTKCALGAKERRALISKWKKL